MPQYLCSNLILAAETPQQNVKEKTNGPDTNNITPPKLHMNTRLKHVIGTVFKTTKNPVICKLSSQHLSCITREFKLPSVCCISTSDTSPWGLGLHPLYELQAMANQPKSFPSLSQESSRLEQQPPLCAFHTGSEKENIHMSKDFCAGAQQHNTVLSSWRTRWGAAKCSSSQLSSVIVSALHLHVSVLVLFSLQIPPAPLPRWAGHREIF